MYLETNSSAPLASFASNRARVRWVTVFLLANVVIGLIAVASDYSQVRLISRTKEGQTISQAEAEANDSRQQAVGMAQLSAFLLTGILFLMWIHRAHGNLPALGARGLKFSPGMAVGWFFVPILNLFQPYQAVREIWKASDPDADVDRLNVFARRSAPGSPIIGGWWVLWLVSTIGGRIVSSLAPRARTADEFLAIGWLILVSDALNVIAALLAIAVVRTINARQEQKRARRAALATPVDVEVLTMPQTAEAYYKRGMNYHKQGDDDNAIADLGAAIRLKPDYADAYIHRGLIYHRRGDYNRAIADLDRAIASDPRDAETYLLRGKWRADNGEREEAVSDLEKALRLGLEPPSHKKNVEALLEKLRQ